MIRTLIALAVTAASACGQGTLIYDQQSSTESFLMEGTTNITPNQPFGQSFTPSLNAVGFVRLDLISGTFSPSGTSMEVLLHSGSISGPVIGTSESVVVPNFGGGFFTFVFDTPVAVTPGTQYYFETVVQTTGNNMLALDDAYNYAGGTAIVSGVADPSHDLWFREGLIVPEPSTWALLLLGAGMIVWLRRR